MKLIDKFAAIALKEMINSPISKEVAKVKNIPHPEAIVECSWALAIEMMNVRHQIKKSNPELFYE